MFTFKKAVVFVFSLMLSNTTEAVRLFVALDMPSSVDFRGVQAYLARRLSERNIPVKLEQTFHITLAYIGDVHPSILGDGSPLDIALQRSANAQGGAITGLSVLPGGSLLGRALALAIYNNPALSYLGKTVRQELNNAGFILEGRKSFLPHLTLLRVPNKALAIQRNYIEQLLSSLVPPNGSYNFAVNSFVLYESFGNGDYFPLKRYFF